MVDKRVLSNKRVAVRIGPDTAIADYQNPQLDEILSLTNVSGAIRWDGFDLNVEASSQGDDRTLEDEAGSQIRLFTQFGGSISFLTPKDNDTSSVVRVTRELVKTPHTKLAVAVRELILNSVGVVVGQVWNVYRVITDANRHARAETGYSYAINFRPQDDVGINRIIPPATPVAVTLTAVGSTSGPVGTPGFVRAAYLGNNITIGAEYVSSDPDVVEIAPNGAYIRKATGSADITATYPGSLPSTALEITVA